MNLTKREEELVDLLREPLDGIPIDYEETIAMLITIIDRLLEVGNEVDDRW